MLKHLTAPHLRRQESPFYQSGGVLLCLLPLLLFSCLYYGIRPVILVAVGMGTAAVVELLCCMVSHRRPSLHDGTALVTGALIGGMMTPLTPFWVPAMGAAFAIGVVKMPFGGTGRNVFNPAAAGMAFCIICFPTRVFIFPDPSLQQALPLFDTSSVVTVVSPAAQLMNNASPAYTWFSFLSGQFPAAIFSIGIMIMLAGGLYLAVRKSSSVMIMAAYFITCTLGALWFPRTDSALSLTLELCSGLLIFTGIFLLCDPVTAPRHWLARLVYGVLAGVLVMLLRHSGRFECCEPFAVLLVNAVAPILDRFCWRFTHRVSEVLEP